MRCICFTFHYSSLTLLSNQCLLQFVTSPDLLLQIKYNLNSKQSLHLGDEHFRVLLLLLAILGQALGIGEHLATGLLLFAKRFLPRARYATIPLDLVQPSTILSVTLHHRATLPHHSDWSIIGEQGRGRGGVTSSWHHLDPANSFCPLASPNLLHNNTSWRGGQYGPRGSLVWQIISFWMVTLRQTSFLRIHITSERRDLVLSGY